MHRDCKPQNLLVFKGADGKVVARVANLGSARRMQPGRKNTVEGTCTLWYKAPEMLLGERHYGGAVDLWAVGAVALELLGGQPAFPGDCCEWDQLMKIFRRLGTPAAPSALRTMPYALPGAWPRWPSTKAGATHGSSARAPAAHGLHRARLRGAAPRLGACCGASSACRSSATRRRRRRRGPAGAPPRAAARGGPPPYLDWMVETAHRVLRMDDYALHVAAGMLRAFVAAARCKGVRLVHAAAMLFLASKLTEMAPMCATDLTRDALFDVAELRAAECEVLTVVDFDLWRVAACEPWLYRVRPEHAFFADLVLYASVAADVVQQQAAVRRLVRGKPEPGEALDAALEALVADDCTVGLRRAYGRDGEEEETEAERGALVVVEL